MSLVWRAALATPGPLDDNRVHAWFGAWAGIRTGVDFEPDGFAGQFHEASDQFELTIESSVDGKSAARAQLAEFDGERETRTTVSLVSGQEETLIAVDIDQFGERQEMAMAPGFLRALLDEREWFSGSIRMPSATILDASAEDVRQACWDTSRRCPIVLIPTDSGSQSLVAASEVERRCRGLAAVFAVGVEILREAGGGLEEVEADAAVIVNPADVLGRITFSTQNGLQLAELSPTRVAERVSTPIQSWSETVSMPKELRAGLRDDIDAARRTDDELVEELIGMEELLENQRKQIVELKLDVEAERKATAQSEHEIHGLRLALRGDEPRPDQDDFDAEAAQPSTCIECAQLTERHLAGLSFPRSDWSATQQLDSAGQSAWPARAWRAFIALDSYVNAKKRGTFTGDFLGFCESGDRNAIPTGWVALHESESTDANGDLRRQRTLPVDVTVSPSGRTYMPAHIKVIAGGSVAPRIHFLDDTEGESGLVHIGYFGEHLPTSGGF